MNRATEAEELWRWNENKTLCVSCVANSTHTHTLRGTRSESTIFTEFNDHTRSTMLMLFADDHHDEKMYMYIFL